MEPHQRKVRAEPTPMGERILAFMQANYITDMQEFAEGVLGIPHEEFMAWIYDPDVSPESLPVRPVLLCAEALSTNAEYLTCMTDDPRPGVALTYDEYVLLTAYNDVGDKAVRERMITSALEIAEQYPRPGAKATTRSPFPRAGGTRRKPPANEPE